MAGGVVIEADLAEVAATRAAAAVEAAAEAREAVARVENLNSGGVPCRLYRPDDAHGLLLFLHGGGFVYGDLNTHDAHCRRMTNRTGWAVLAVDYRRAPEHPYPAAVEDATAVGDWLTDAAADLAGSGPVVVSGDSAGANLALTVALRSPAAYAGLVLVYPFLDASCRGYDRSIPDPDFPVEELAWFWRLYLRSADDEDQVTADPLRATSYAGLPATLLQLAELDVLTTTGRDLARRLTDDGVDVETLTYPGVGHGFWRHDDNEQHAPAQADLARFLGSMAPEED